MPVCSICQTQFEVHFRYQREDRVESLGSGISERRTIYFCSQRCLEASHRERADGQVACDACARPFEVELASQVLFTGGRRHYVCGSECRSRVLDGVRCVRLGEYLDPTRAEQAEADAAASLVEGREVRAQPTEPSVAPGNVRPPGTLTQPPVAQHPSAAPHSIGQPRVFAVFNHKGGTAKTTTAVSLAAGLAQRGRRVLLVDTDGQGNVGVSLGLRFERSLYHVIVMGLAPEQAIVSASAGFDVLPANETLAAAELYLAGRKNRDQVLASRLKSALPSYDYVIVDCSPSLSLLNQNALVMADAVLCPVACDYLALVGVRQVLRTIRHVNQFLRHPVQLWGILPTFFDARARICREALETLQERFNDRCLPPIRVASKVKEAPSQGKTLLEYAPGSTAAADYLAVVDRMVSNDLGETALLRAGGGVA